ncbi:hypothetical protein N7499_000837 [Penicillium canescens]|uniref:Dolichyl-diphosphooligosaccharide--protein glycosyltransferase subunit 4 n=1 Tax=Penicillium canescens TaxID=5083 RepID=A0AAD6NBJ3_PENCN|nr:uncharacterized protein N7446_010958 [Penicillium canescens]KAJ6007173.1 hypothetical protein N7522_005524 [Penicillium canescens]KAJ6029690.1 hypothetical protein N7444_012677 [Penicillium canescens]KAJ6048122.1 hypothetical protein N7460_004269 [Penicillium canescens]KAJ6048275.1 hypothetical protein N7446_010958 [Penicillium canescens]KAJ6101207.1 hypothetical protein N7499_000837 [Penicillium canescens]
MISDDDLYRLAIFLGSCAMMMIVLYHFLDVNAIEEETADTVSQKAEDSAPLASTDTAAASGRN